MQHIMTFEHMHPSEMQCRNFLRIHTLTHNTWMTLEHTHLCFQNTQAWHMRSKRFLKTFPTWQKTYQWLLNTSLAYNMAFKHIYLVYNMTFEHIYLVYNMTFKHIYLAHNTSVPYNTGLTHIFQPHSHDTWMPFEHTHTHTMAPEHTNLIQNAHKSFWVQRPECMIWFRIHWATWCKKRRRK